MIGIFSNGWRTNRSGSPVIIQSAFPKRASSKYISSLGSRHHFTCSVISTVVERDLISSRNDCLTSFETYRSNFFRIITSINSASTGLDINKVEEIDFTLSKATPGREVSNNKALIKTLQSKTRRIYSSLSNSSRISGVKPFFLACSLASSMISSRLLRLEMRRFNVSAMAFFSLGDILAIFSATGSLTSKVIVFITLNFQ